MTNFEKYKDDLMKIEGTFAFDKNTREVVGCDCDTTDGLRCIECKDCLFNSGQCFESDKIKWLHEEYKEPIFILSDDELELINILSKVYGKEFKYIHRTGHHVFIFSDKPPVDKYSILLDKNCNYIEISGHGYTDLFPNIKFTDGLYDIENKCFIV